MSYCNELDLVDNTIWADETGCRKQLSRKLRVVLYSHDTMGLGHMRRNILMAQALANSDLSVSVLLIAGAHEASYFRMPTGVDCLTLPALRKEANGQYRSRHLDVSVQKLTDVRAKSICAALEAFEPDVFIVDKEPLGANGELELTLKRLRNRGYTRFVLGLRDVLDKPISVSRKVRCESCMSKEDDIRNYYDAVWIYGDPNIYDLASECGFSPDIVEKVDYTGYFDQQQWLESSRHKEFKIPWDSGTYNSLVACMVGGGQDGADVALAFAKATLPQETCGVVVTGPCMPQEAQRKLHHIASFHSGLHIIEFLSEPVLLTSRADKIISMGGYNTICEVLSFKKQALIVPRVKPRLEQFVRAERLNNLGLLDILHPNELNPGTLTDWMAQDFKKNLPVRDRIDLNGLKRLPGMLEELLDTSHHTARSKFHQEEVPHVTCQTNAYKVRVEQLSSSISSTWS